MRKLLLLPLALLATPHASANTLHSFSVAAVPGGTGYTVAIGGIWPSLCWDEVPQRPPVQVATDGNRVTVRVGTAEPILCFASLAEWAAEFEFEPHADGYYDFEVLYVDVFEEKSIGSARALLFDRATIFRDGLE
jgi:hypothetical protein